MRYLTKEWYELCQKTYLDFGMEAMEETSQPSEELYLQLYRKKEKEYIENQRELYDSDPHCLLDEEKYKKEFLQIQTEFIKMKEELLKEFGLMQCVADVRIFALGYCTKKVLEQLKIISKKNREKVEQISEACCNAAKLEKIPESLRQNFGFHDCKVTDMVVGKDIIIQLDTEGEYATFDTVTFVNGKVRKQDDSILEKRWIYDELYKTEQGYEAHMLFDCLGLSELTIECDDILFETRTQHDSPFTKLY